MHTDIRYPMVAEGALSGPQVVKLGTEGQQVKATAAITDIPYGVIFVEVDQDLVDGDFVTVLKNGEVPCVAGGSISRGDWVVGTAAGAVIALPDDAVEETAVVALGQAMEDAGTADEFIVDIKPVAFTIPAAGS